MTKIGTALGFSARPATPSGTVYLMCKKTAFFVLVAPAGACNEGVIRPASNAKQMSIHISWAGIVSSDDAVNERVAPGGDVEAPSFSDVTIETAHADDIAWLAATGVSKGWDVAGGGREFRPYADVARADMAAFLHRLDGLRA
ncbi:MAG: S-layer homology domain-containing protein [Atopobiaceae bacterium]|nr:S-layer homology domain-containing protein [Atopobiaceae bacterium]